MDTAKEHMAWYKKRALAYLDRGSQWYSPKESVASMLSDLRKHPETAKLIGFGSPLGMFGLMSTQSHEEAKQFITGFTDF